MTGFLPWVAEQESGKFHERDGKIFGEVEGSEVCYSEFNVKNGWFDGMDCPRLTGEGLELAAGQVKRIGKIQLKYGDEAAREKIKDYIEAAEYRLMASRCMARNPGLFLGTGTDF